MRRLRSVLVAVLVAAAPASAGLPAKEKKEGTKTPTLAVSRWLVLGPVPSPLPVFHDEKPGGYAVGDLLEAEILPPRALAPRPGRSEAWPGAAPPPAWIERGTGESGRLELDEGETPRVAWLAAFVETDRFRSIDLELTGAHPRRAWVDGEGVVLGGLANEGAGAEAKGTLKLAPGKHTLLLETVHDASRKERWSAGAVLSSASGLDGIGIGLDPTRPLGILDVLDAPQVASLAASPDGATAAIEWSRILPGTDDTETWVELRSLEDGRVLQTRRGGAAIGQVAFAPGGKRWSYVTKDKAEADKDLSSLWVADLSTGAVEPVLERAENLASYAWSPSGDAIVFAARIKPEPDKRGVKLHRGLLDKRAGHRDRTVLGIVSVPGGTRRRITAGELSASVESFSPDGRRLLVRRQREELDRRPFTMDELWEVDLATLASKKLLESGWVQAARFAPDGRRILVLSGPSEFGGIGVETPEGVTPNESQGELYVWDPASGAATCITKGFDPSISDATWSPFDGNVYFRATDADAVRLFRWSQFSKRIDRLDTGGDVMQEWAFARFAPVAVASTTSPWTPEAVHVVDLASGAARKIAGPPDAWFESVTRGTVEPLRFTGSGGAPIDGRVYLPPGFDPKRTGGYPAIVFYYGGILPVSREFGGRYPKEWWAAQGYVVYVPQPSGAMGYGQAFAAKHVNDWGATTTGEILEGTRKFLDAYPAVDRKRVGGIGASYGGFMTMVLAAKTDLFAALVSHAGISSLASYWGEGYWGYSYSGVATADSFPWNRKDIYVERSPLFSADKVKTPILLTHGAADTNVPVGESDSYYTALKLLGAEAEFVEVAGQDHWILDHAKRIVWSKTIVAWFDRWLKGSPEWWNELYPAPK